MISQDVRYSDQMARRIRSLQRGSFDSLLRGGVYTEEEARAILPYLEVRSCLSGYCLGLVRARRASRTSFLRHSDDEPAGDCAERVLSVHIGHRGYVYRRSADELVILWSEPEGDGAEAFRRRVTAAAAELGSRNGTTLEYGMSEWRTSLVEAHRALRDAERKLETGALCLPAPGSGGEADRSVPLAGLSAREPARSVQQHILSHYREPDLALCSIARHLGLTETYLSQAFREQTGVTYSCFLERLRVEAARRHLETDSLTVAAIAARVGYQTNSTFFRAFRRIHGRSPSAYRRAARTEQARSRVVHQ